MLDKFETLTPSLVTPASTGFAITPTDGADLPEITRALYVGGTGTLRVIMQSGAEITLANVPAGTILPIRIGQLAATGTTASDIVGLA